MIKKILILATSLFFSATVVLSFMLWGDNKKLITPDEFLKLCSELSEVKAIGDFELFYSNTENRSFYALDPATTVEAKNFLTFDGTLSTNPTQYFYGYKGKNEDIYIFFNVSYMDTVANNNLIMIDGLAELLDEFGNNIISDFAYQVYIYQNLLIHIDVYSPENEDKLYDALIIEREAMLNNLLNYFDTN